MNDLCRDDCFTMTDRKAERSSKFEVRGRRTTDRWGLRKKRLKPASCRTTMAERFMVNRLKDGCLERDIGETTHPCAAQAARVGRANNVLRCNHSPTHRASFN